MIRRTSSRVAVLAVLAVLALAPSAMAQGSAHTTYAGNGGQVESLIAGGQNGPSADDPSGLPFTGFDVGVALGGGVLLLTSGLALGRLVSHRDPA